MRLSVVAGVVLFAAAALGGHVFDGALIFGALVIFGLAPNPRGNPLSRRTDLNATAMMGLVLMLAVIAGFVYQIGAGLDGWPFSWLAALGALTYLAVLANERRRDRK